MKKKSILKIAEPRIQGNTLTIEYSFNGHHFSRGVGFLESVSLEQYKDDLTFQKLVRCVILADSTYAFGLDYYDIIEVDFTLDKDTINFFEKAMFLGLAEFRYVNNLDMNKKVTIIAATDNISDGTLNHHPIVAENSTAFVLNGGGKDGVVAIDIAARLGLGVKLLSSGGTNARQYVAETACLSLFTMERITDGYVVQHAKYTGHKPMSLYMAFVSTLAAYICGKQYVISANEHSASFANLEKDGVAINHQYTKSVDFERDLGEFLVRQNIPTKYFSSTRQLYELQVLKIFADNNEEYHTGFISCNEMAKESTWCKNCPKCAFVIGAMYLFNGKSARKVWGAPERVFNEQLINHLIELINPNIKPLECIGTTEENRFLARQLLDKKIITLNAKQTKVYQSYLANGRNDFDESNLYELNGNNLAPPELNKKIDDAIMQLLDNTKKKEYL